MLTQKLKFDFSQAPHLKTEDNVRWIMLDVIVALVPAVLLSVFYFGIDSISVIMTAVIACVFFEGVSQSLLKKEITVLDGSAAVTGVLLAFNLPSTSPWWLTITGSFIAVVIVKQLFGGLGKNIFNPALAARVFLLLAFPVQMTARWVRPMQFFQRMELSRIQSALMQSIAAEDVAGEIQAVASATPLAILKEQGADAASAAYTHMDAFFGFIPGSLGEVSAFALLLGAAFLILRGRIKWHIPGMYIASFFAVTGVFYFYDPIRFADPVYHLLTGGLVLGAFFMATDMTTSPVTPKGMIIFGLGAGIITAAIRLWGAMPEGVSFAILIMNAFVPLLDKYTLKRKFGGK